MDFIRPGASEQRLYMGFILSRKGDIIHLVLAYDFWKVRYDAQKVHAMFASSINDRQLCLFSAFGIKLGADRGKYLVK